MSQLPTNPGRTDNPKATIRYIDQHTTEAVHTATGHTPHELDMMVTLSDGRKFALVNHSGKIHIQEYIGSIEDAYRSFLARPATAYPTSERIPVGRDESTGYGHGV